MRRDYKVLKFKLMRGTGREIWGEKLTRHGRFLRSRRRNPWVVSRKVVNFMILEFERRVVFDYAHRYSSFGRDRKIIFPGFFKFVRLRGSFLFLRIIKKYTDYFFSSLRKKNSFTPYAKLEVKRGTVGRLRRVRVFQEGQVRHFARRLRIQKPMLAGDEPWVPITRTLLNYMYAWRKTVQNKNFGVIHNLGKNEDALNTRYPYINVTIPFEIACLRGMSDSKDVRTQARYFLRGLESTCLKVLDILTSPEAHVSLINSMFYSNKVTAKSRWHNPRYLQIWPKDFGNPNLPIFLNEIEKFVVQLRERERAKRENKIPWTVRYNLSRVTRHKGNFFVSWKLMINPSDAWGSSLAKRLGHVVVKLLEKENQYRNDQLSFSNIWKWLFRTFPEKQGRTCLSNNDLVVHKSRLCSSWFNEDYGYGKIGSIQDVSTVFVKRLSLSPIFGDHFYGQSMVRLSNHIFGKFSKTVSWLSGMENKPGLNRDASAPSDPFAGASWVLSGFNNSVIKRIRAAVISHSCGFLRALRKRQRDLSLGTVRRRLQDFRNFILRLDYSNLRIAFGDYEEGFRIPNVPGDQYNKSKKQYRLLEKFRLESFYGVFSMSLFLEKYHELFNKNTNSSPGKVYQLMECRIIFLLHRTNLFPSMYFLDQMISHGNALFEGVQVRDPHIVVGVGHKLYVPLKYYWFSINVFLRRTFTFRNILNTPTYLEMNYTLLALSPVMVPLSHQLTFPFSTHSTRFDPFAVVRKMLR